MYKKNKTEKSLNEKVSRWISYVSSPVHSDSWSEFGVFVEMSWFVGLVAVSGSGSLSTVKTCNLNFTKVIL